MMWLRLVGDMSLRAVPEDEEQGVVFCSEDSRTHPLMSLVLRIKQSSLLYSTGQVAVDYCMFNQRMPTQLTPVSSFTYRQLYKGVLQSRCSHFHVALSFQIPINLPNSTLRRVKETSGITSHSKSVLQSLSGVETRCHESDFNEAMNHKQNDPS